MRCQTLQTTEKILKSVPVQKPDDCMSILFKCDGIINSFKQSKGHIPVVPAENKLPLVSGHPLCQPTVTENYLDVTSFFLITIAVMQHSRLVLVSRPPLHGLSHTLWSWFCLGLEHNIPGAASLLLHVLQMQPTRRIWFRNMLQCIFFPVLFF